MERKGGTSTAVVTSEQVKAALPRTRTLTSEEEKALRMRHGVSVKELGAPLPRAAGGNAELEDELLLIEMQLLRAYRAKTGNAAARPQVARVAESVAATGAKGKIIRALRKKK